MSMLNGIHHLEVHTTELDPFLEFFLTTFQTVTGPGVPGSGRREGFVDVGGGGLLHVVEVDPGKPAGDEHLAFSVPSREALTEARARLMARGFCDGRVKDFGPEWAMPFRDPEGRRCELMWQCRPGAPIQAPRWRSGTDLP